MSARRVSPLFGFRAIIAAATMMLAMMIIMATSFWLARGGTPERLFTLPLPARLAAIVELIETSTPEQRDRALRAVNAGSYNVYIADDPGVSERRSGVAFNAFKRAISRYTDALDGRNVYGMFGGRKRGVLSEPIVGESGLEANYPMRLAVELGPDEFLIVETPNLLDMRLRRVPTGLLVGITAFFVAILALVAIITELRPISDMAVSARRFAQFGKPRHVKPGGSREMQGLIDEFNQMQDRIARLMANRTLVMSAMSHDVRTYLTRLRLRIEKLDAADREAAVRALEAIQALLDDTLAFAEAESGEAPEDRVNLAELLGEIKRSQIVIEEQMSISGDCSVDITGHRARLERAFVNIITNAVKYAGAVETACARNGDEVVVTFADRGPGIADEEKEKVLEPFYRSDAARNLNTSGSGLGLAISRTIIERHDGTLSLHDRPDGGLIVKVVLKASHGA